MLSHLFPDQLKDAKQNALALLDTKDAVSEENINKVLSISNEGKEKGKEKEVYVTEQLWEDTGLHTYLKTATITVGGGQFLWNIVQELTTDTKLLKARQSAVLPTGIARTMREFADLEKDVLWLFTVPEIGKAWPLNMLFPTAPGLRLINNFPYILEGFHLYRCYGAAYMNIITPITTILAPWIYVRRSMKWKVPLKSYIKLLFTAFSAGFRVTGNLRGDFSRVLTILVYIVLFIYTAVQAFETAAMLRRIRKDLHAKLQSIRRFVEVAQAAIASTPHDTLVAWGIDPQQLGEINIPSGTTGLYKLLTDAALKDQLRHLVRAMYGLDAAAFTKSLVETKLCVPVSYSDTDTTMWNMGHVLLGKKQIRNPIGLQRNIIVTGPNAAGKTTYIRALFTNIILAQSLGIACASRAIVQPVHAIGTFIRVSDTLGKASLFEAEAQRCADIVLQAQRISDRGHAALFFLDEPMHSTPPLEGMSTCRAVLEHLAGMPGIRTVTTTHYIEVTQVAKDMPHAFVNLSMTAIPVEALGCSFKFPYKIKAGVSGQCIALELLHDHQLPRDIVVRAIELKNKFYPVDVNEQRTGSD
jgi:hypothetical protein